MSFTRNGQSSWRNSQSELKLASKRYWFLGLVRQSKRDVVDEDPSNSARDWQNPSTELAVARWFGLTSLFNDKAFKTPLFCSDKKETPGMRARERMKCWEKPLWDNRQVQFSSSQGEEEMYYLLSNNDSKPGIVWVWAAGKGPQRKLDAKP
jgi:hypothetical protein